MVGEQREQQKERRRERESEQRHLEAEGEREMTLPAWRRHISDLSLGGRRRRLIAAEHGPLENRQEKSITV